MKKKIKKSLVIERNIPMCISLPQDIIDDLKSMKENKGIPINKTIAYCYRFAKEQKVI